MKLEPRRIDAFLRDPGSTRLVLLHGDDHGLVRERATRLVKAVAGSVDDPFDVVELDRDDAAALPAEMTSQSLSGRRRVIRLREAGDGAAEPVRRALAGPGRAFAVLEAGSLTVRSKLRVLAEQAADALVIACYPLDQAAAAAAVTQSLRAASVEVDEETARWMAEAVAGDQALLRREVEKLALYVGSGGRADLETAMLCAGDIGQLSLEDALFAATSGEVGRTDRALETAMSEGATPVGVIRGALMHMQRLVQARLAVDGGEAPSDAIKRLRPPVHFRRVAAFSRSLMAGRGAEFEALAQRLAETERACKRTGAPAEALARGALLTVARRMAAARRN